VNEQILVGTPGTTLLWIERRHFDPKHVRMLVLDEADNMLSMDMRDNSVRIRRCISEDHQLLLFSATYPDEVQLFVQEQIPLANTVVLTKAELTLDGIKQYWVDCRSAEERYRVLCDLYGAIAVGQVIIFCEKVSTAKELSDAMKYDGHAVSVLFGGKDALKMEHWERDQIINDFRDGTTRVLITTNVLSRGIDISKVNVVINFDVPINHDTRQPDTETYLHRIGRTGRFGRKGVGINLSYNRWTRAHIEEIERFFGRPIKKISTDDPDALEKMLVL